MNCYPEIVLRRFASGELDEPGMKEVLRHAESCARCRHALQTAERDVATQLLVLADRKDWFSPHPRSLKARVFSAVADDRTRRARQVGARKRYRRIAPALAAAAVLLLILGARYLGGPRWNGRLEATRGALLLSPSGESFSVVDRLESLPPGGLVFVPAGSAGELVFSGDGEGRDARLELPSSALLVIGDTDGGPRISVARGIVRIRETPSSGLLVNAGGQELLVRGSGEIEVRCDSTASALSQARTWSARIQSGAIASILPAAEAAGGPHGASFFVRIQVHEGSVLRPGTGPLATAGCEVFNRAGTGWCAAVRSPTGRILSANLLTEPERAAVSVLFGRHTDAVRSLTEAATDPLLVDWQRGLATWLLGELGDRRAVPALTRLLAPASGVPVEVRAAAVRSLSLLGELDPVLGALADEDDAVAETAILSLPPGSGEQLQALAASNTRPDWQRALAAFRADEMGVRVGISTLLALLESTDPDVRRQAQTLISRIPDEVGDVHLLDLARNGTDVERARAITSLAMRDTPESIPIALAGARQLSSPAVRAASIRLIARLAPEQIDEFIDEALAPSDPQVLSAILWGLCRIEHSGKAPLAGHEDALRRIAFSSRSAVMVRVMAMSLLDDPELVRMALGANPAPDLLRGTLEYAALGNLFLDDVDLIRRSTQHPDARLRIAAIDALARVHPEEAVRLLEREFREGEEDPLELLDILTSPHMGGREDELEEVLVGLFREHSNLLVRMHSADLLGRRVRAGRVPVIDALFAIAETESEPAAVRSSAMHALQSLPDSPRLDRLLLDALHSNDAAVAIPAARLLRTRRDRDLPIGIRVLGSVSSERARALVLPLCRAGRDDIRSLLRSRDEFAASTVLCDLTEDDLSEFIEEIANLAKASEPMLRALAICRLPAFDGDRAVLNERLRDPDPLVRLTAAIVLSGQGLSPLPDEALQWLVHAIRLHHLLRLRPLGAELAAGVPTRDLRPLIEQELRLQLNMSLDPSPLEILRRQSLEFGESTRRAAAKQARLAIPGERLAILGEDVDGLGILDAVTTLAWAGERADVAMLLGLAEAEQDGMSALQDRCRVSVEALLGRTNEGLGGGVGTVALARWWEQRRYGLEVPSLKTRALSTQR